MTPTDKSHFKTCVGSLRTHTNYVDCNFPNYVLKEQNGPNTSFRRSVDTGCAGPEALEPEAKGLHPGLFPSA